MKTTKTFSNGYTIHTNNLYGFKWVFKESTKAVEYFDGTRSAEVDKKTTYFSGKKEYHCGVAEKDFWKEYRNANG